MILDNETYELSEFFKNFSDYTRLKIIRILFHGPLKVKEIAKLAETTQTAVSYQLRILRISRLVKCIKQGRNVIYELDDEHIYNIISIASDHLGE